MILKNPRFDSKRSSWANHHKTLMTGSENYTDSFAKLENMENNIVKSNKNIRHLDSNIQDTLNMMAKSNRRVIVKDSMLDPRCKIKRKKAISKIDRNTMGMSMRVSRKRNWAINSNMEVLNSTCMTYKS